MPKCKFLCNKDKVTNILLFQSKVPSLAVLVYEIHPDQLEKLLSKCSPTDLQIHEKAYFCGKFLNYWRRQICPCNTFKTIQNSFEIL